MSETIRKKPELRHKSTQIVAGLLALSALAGCSFGERIHGQSAKLRTCQPVLDSKGYPNKLITTIGSTDEVTSVSEVITEAKSDIRVLDRRALANGGSIDVPQHRVTEVKASLAKLTLRFSAKAGALWNTTDNITFPIIHGEPQVDAGAVVCTQDNQLYPNFIFSSLETYTQETAALDQ